MVKILINQIPFNLVVRLGHDIVMNPSSSPGRGVLAISQTLGRPTGRFGSRFSGN